MNLEDIKFPRVLFLSGIGTDVGKTFATAWLASLIIESGKNCITQKFIQTGNRLISEDIELHRRLMGMSLQEVDMAHITAPVIFTYPASPHLAAAIDGTEVDLGKISDATDRLLEEYENLIIEGAGGLMVPVKGEYLTIDYIRDKGYPVVLVVTGQLGSINHALLSLHALETYGIPLFAVIYNSHFDEDKVICDDTRSYLRNWTGKHFPGALWLEMKTFRNQK